MKIECPNCNRWYDLPTEPGVYKCEVCGNQYHISRTSTPPQRTRHCPGCEAAARELAVTRETLAQISAGTEVMQRELAALRAQIEAKAAEWAAAQTSYRMIEEGLAKNLAAKELRALLAETEAK